MSQYWLQIPVENAREVVQRKIDELSSTLTQLKGYTVSYDADCEVVLDGVALNANQSIQINNIYFGTFVVNFQGYFGASINIVDEINEGYQILSWVNNQCASGHYPYIIWNHFNADGFQTKNGYFFGYKFKLGYQEQTSTKIRFYHPSDTNYNFDIGTFGQSQDDTNVTVVQENGTKNTFSIYRTPINGTPVHIECYNPSTTPGWYEIKCDADINYADFVYSQSNDYYDIELINANKLTYLNLNSAVGLPDTSVDKVIADLVDYNQTNGTLVTPNNGYFATIPSKPSVKANYDTLVGRGWTIS